MDVSANPSISYSYGCHNFLSSPHSHAFIGLYIGEYTLGGDFVQDVVNQQITLWDLTHRDNFSGSNAGVPLSATILVDSNHFYEIWVWVGGDAEGKGWTGGTGSDGRSELNAHIPSISVHAY